MFIRSPRERIFQALTYQLFGLCLSIPIYLLYSGKSLEGGALVMLAISAAELLSCPLHNFAFDAAECRLTGRLASDRSQGWRITHAVSHELTMSLICVPLLVALGGHGLLEALALDLGLTVVYILYAYGFHLTYDRLRPVRRVPSGLFAS